MKVGTCERCGEEKELEKYSYRVVCAEGTVNIDTMYCTVCCDEIEQLTRDEEQGL
jgi:hypothetical protein